MKVACWVQRGVPYVYCVETEKQLRNLAANVMLHVGHSECDKNYKQYLEHEAKTECIGMPQVQKKTLESAIMYVADWERVNGNEAFTSFRFLDVMYD